MISSQENELLTRVEGDAPMGVMMREHHWIPALRAGRVIADGAPIRVRLFGKNYVAWRNTEGQVGFLDEACPHRGVSLALARNENCALQCIFHGWRINVDGQVIEAPNEHKDPEGFARRVKVSHYPAREAGGLLWVWLGSGKPVAFPDIPYANVPPEQLFIASTTIPVNYLQGLEATLDSSHIGFLHRDWVQTLGDNFKGAGQNLAPRFEIRKTDYGFRGAALRDLGDGTVLARLNEFVLPFHSSTSTGDPEEGTYQILVPVDDTHTLWIFVRWHRNQSLQESETILAKPDADIDDWVPSLGGPDQYWGQDRASMENGTSFAGFHAGLLTEDTVVQISMGPIVDRTKEHLCSGDLAIVWMRRLLLEAARDHLAGREPLGARPSLWHERLYAVAGVMPEEEDWQKHFAA